MTAIGGNEQPKKNTLRWALITLSALVVLFVAQCSIALAKDPSKTPLNLTDAGAAGNCIGELQLEYQANGMHIVGRAEDFTVTSKTDVRTELDGKVTLVDLNTGGSFRRITCVVERGKDGSVQTSPSVR
ncbi:hypothetical protein KNN17_08060 [Arthrobacter bambusae]|uniref:hypothetical protein n=1 Tax=Arthrobacter bambusae TaxID=1338426 RepID=UPI001F504F93|nr:hypothetical protein [Arthrobacter bambusae]MCI0141533.1 hypothetical protein [Arthrobacter bambusae]